MEIKSVFNGVNPYEQKKIDDLNKAKNAAKSSGAKPGGNDTVSVSQEARLTGTALRTAQAAPDVRADKIAELKRQIKDGTYKPDIRKTAKNLIRDDLSLIS